MGWLARRLGLRPAEHRMRLQGEALVPMRDGARLRTRHLGPVDPGPRPTVLVRTPYGIGWNPPMFLGPLLARALARRGYHVLLQDARGRYGSEGGFTPFLHEREDGLDTLAWIEKQAFYDGRLGMWGPSYLGYTQWSVAAEARGRLQAIVPIVTASDFYGLFYPGGAFSLITALRWASSNGERTQKWPPERRLPAAARARPLRHAARAVGRPAAFFEDWTDHPERDDYWHAIDRTAARLEARVPALLVAGTYDIFCGPQVEDFASSPETRWLDLGPYAHGTNALSARKLGWKRANPLRILSATLPFLDHHLLGHELSRGRVRRYVQGEDHWCDEPDWPPPDARPTRLHLRSGGRLLAEPPGGDEDPDAFTYDPEDPVPTRGGTFLGPRCGPADQRPLEGRADVLRYDTPPLARALHLAGPVRASLRAGSDAPATDFTAKLVQLPADPARPQLNLCEGIARRDPAPTPAAPVEIDLWHASVSLPAGDRLRLEISSSNFPRFDAHPNLPGPPAHATTSRPARQTVHHARDAASYVELTVRGDPC